MKTRLAIAHIRNTLLVLVVVLVWVVVLALGSYQIARICTTYSYEVISIAISSPCPSPGLIAPASPSPQSRCPYLWSLPFCYWALNILSSLAGCGSRPVLLLIRTWPADAAAAIRSPVPRANAHAPKTVSNSVNRPSEVAEEGLQWVRGQLLRSG